MIATREAVQVSAGSPPTRISGLLLGVLAVLCWSFGSSLVFCGAKEAGTWPFVAIASLTGGVIQLVARRLSQGELATAVWLPWRLWAVPVLCFVAYGLAWPLALATSGPSEVFGVSLINYLWPVLTVVFSAWWVPGVKLTGRTFLALGLAVVGLGTANLDQLHAMLRRAEEPAGSTVHLLPFFLAAIAALTWAIYSAILVHWRTWGQKYVTSPIGFILTGLIACLVMFRTENRPAGFSLLGGVMTLLYAVGPLATGYLCWELALPKTKVETLSLIAAATPVLSTLILCVFLRTMPGPELVVAAVLVSVGIVLSRKA